MKTLLQTIDQYDREQRAYIDDLETKNEQLRTKNGELTDQIVSYVDTVDRMKLDLILSGALVRPESVAVMTARVAKLEEALRFYAAEDERNGWGGVASAALAAEGS